MSSYISTSKFRHRPNRDGSFDSICLKCFLTAGSRANEVDLEEVEQVHAARCVSGPPEPIAERQPQRENRPEVVRLRVGLR